MNSIELKQATIEDLPIIIELGKSVAYFKTYSAITEREEALGEFEKNIIYLIQLEGETAGVISYEIKDINHVYLSDFIIDPKFQGKGFGREALRQLLEKLSNIKRIDLVTHPDNLRAINLYQSFGFVVGERIENYFDDGEPRVFLSRINN